MLWGWDKNACLEERIVLVKFRKKAHFHDPIDLHEYFINIIDKLNTFFGIKIIRVFYARIRHAIELYTVF